VKLLLVVVDGASPRVVNPAIQTGRLANLERIADAGSLHAGSLTIFPSITPAATTSIVTGTYPAEHGIGGASWYDEARGEVAYYGDDFWVIARRGLGDFLRDFLVQLNGARLKAPTLFEMVERSGTRAACVNYLVYRGDTTHRVHVPWLAALLPGVPVTAEVHGPSLLCLGDFVTPRTWRGRRVEGEGGLLHRFGMDDASTARMLCELAEDDALPAFTLAYFPDNDFKSHDVGPHAALPVIDRVDAALGELFDAAGGFDRFVRETCVVVTSDHGHVEVLADRDASVLDLDALFGDFRRATLGKPWRPQDEILICPNMRAAQVHLREPSAVLLDRVVQAASRDARVDAVLWKRGRTVGPSELYEVASPRGRLEFWRGDEGPSAASDGFGTTWSWRGEPATLGLDTTDGLVESAEYPNPFERIAGALDAADQGAVWLSARPGCEFEAAGGKAHAGGASHGALHALDTLSLALVGGATAPELPRRLRSVDIAPLCMRLLGLRMRYEIGAPRPPRPSPVVPAAGS
jgi:hypothetical protein